MTADLHDPAPGDAAPDACPFCGSHDTGLGTLFTRDGGSYCIMCRRCGAEGPHRGDGVFSEAEAIAAWNRRCREVLP